MKKTSLFGIVVLMTGCVGNSQAHNPLMRKKSHEPWWQANTAHVNSNWQSLQRQNNELRTANNKLQNKLKAITLGFKNERKLTQSLYQERAALLQLNALLANKIRVLRKKLALMDKAY